MQKPDLYAALATELERIRSLPRQALMAEAGSGPLVRSLDSAAGIIELEVHLVWRDPSRTSLEIQGHARGSSTWHHEHLQETVTVEFAVPGHPLEGLPPEAPLGSVCAYFWIGVSIGIKTPEDISEWAYRVIAELDVPPIEIIEIATARSQWDAMDALKAGAQSADWQMAARWLLRDTGNRLLAGEHDTVTALWISMKIVDITALSEALRLELSILEDEVDVVASGVVSAETLKTELADLLLMQGDNAT